MARRIIFIVSLFLALGLMCRGAAWLAFTKGEADDQLYLVKWASLMDPLVSDYAYEEYRQTDDLDALKRAIRLEPSKAVNHMYYGLMLIERLPRT